MAGRVVGVVGQWTMEGAVVRSRYGVMTMDSLCLCVGDLRLGHNGVAHWSGPTSGTDVQTVAQARGPQVPARGCSGGEEPPLAHQG
jgi:hypothetical protein